MKFIILSAFAVISFTAGAQAQEQQCLDNVAKLCGDTLLGDCFSDDVMWSKIIPSCEGDIQTMIEMEREALAQENPAKGAALGGKVRGAPGTQHPQTGSLAEGVQVELLYDTGEMFNGYPWFEVGYPNDKGEYATGYVWGGILCSFDAEFYGVYNQCPAAWSGMEQEIAPQHSNN